MTAPLTTNEQAQLDALQAKQTAYENSLKFDAAKERLAKLGKLPDLIPGHQAFIDEISKIAPTLEGDNLQTLFNNLLAVSDWSVTNLRNEINQAELDMEIYAPAVVAKG